MFGRLIPCRLRQVYLNLQGNNSEGKFIYSYYLNPKIMMIEQIYTGCLAQGAYYILDNGEAAIIDPLREIAPYLQRIERDGVKLKYIFETHFHADFVSGHLDLHRKTGAPIVYGPTAKPDFDAHIGLDNEIFKVGRCTIKLLHTPGHTLESSCYLVYDELGKEVAIFTGDTLFLGDVGRPDLAQKGELTKEKLASMLYDSLMQKIYPLPDSVLVYPAHGQGSACGKNMMKETVDTLGNQKKMNYALNQKSKEDFVQAVLENLPPAPEYFAMNVKMNKNGYNSFEQVLAQGMRPLSPQDFKTLASSEEVLILDTREAGAFAQGFVPGSINIGLDGQFAPWVGMLLRDVNQALLLVTEKGREEECVTRLSRVGFDNVWGYLEGGIVAWLAAGEVVDKVQTTSVLEILPELQAANLPIVDLRRQGEFCGGHLPNAENLPLDFINDWTDNLRGKKEHFYIHCQGGYRSMIAASILQARGIRNFTEIREGMGYIRAQKIPLLCS